MLAVGAVSVAALAALLLRPWLEMDISMMLFVPTVVAAAFYGGLFGGLTAAGLSEVAAVLLVPESGWFAIVVRLAILIVVAVVVASMSARQLDILGTLEERVAVRTAELEKANEALNAEIAQRTELERHLAYLVDHDPLTGLLNRRRFEELLAEEVAREARYRRGGAVLLIDLDHFKEVNDTLGHQAGDRLLKTVGTIFRECVRQTDAVARIGGDEFGILLRHVDAHQAEQIAEAIVKATRDRVELGIQSVSVTASIGYAMLDGAPMPQLLARADFAMYEAKKSGRDACVGHGMSVDRERQGSRRSSEYERLRRAIDEHRFVLYWQPIVDLAHSTVSQYELLLRILGERDEPLAPGSFLSLAERHGLIAMIDLWVVKEAITLIAEQTRMGSPLTLNVNISGQSIGNPALVEVIDRTFRDTGVDPGRLVFEVTETAAIANIDEARAFAEQLRVRGCQFALDDFGTGFGSFYYLKHIPFDYLKIDGDFIRGFLDNPTDTLVVEAIVGIARGMGKKTVAEFVTDPHMVNRLRESGVDYAQGYELGAPEPVSVLASRV
jgi:diguanylate cyclase (GGDEF)-like protein